MTKRDIGQSDIILSIRPCNESDARQALGEANRLDCSKRVKEHFADHIKRLQ